MYLLYRFKVSKNLPDFKLQRPLPVISWNALAFVFSILVKFLWILIAVQVMVPITLQIGISTASPVEGIYSHLGTRRYQQVKAKALG